MKMVAYVDGSFDESRGVYGFGIVSIHPNGAIEIYGGANDNKELCLLRNVTGEMLGAMNATKLAIKLGYDEIEIHYDYNGIEYWVTGDWKAKKIQTIQYRIAMRKWMDEIRISFKKVKAHDGDLYNEMADKAAKEAVYSFHKEVKGAD